MAFLCHFAWQECIDSLWRTVKRLAARASLQQPYTIHQIMTSRQLVNWEQTNIQNMNFEFVTELEFVEEEKLLFKRDSAAKLLNWNS
jgi:hypothetical protein